VNFDGDQNMQAKKAKVRTSFEEEKRQNDTSIERIGKLIIIVSVVLIGLGIAIKHIGVSPQLNKILKKDQRKGQLESYLKEQMRTFQMGQGVELGYLSHAVWGARWYENCSNVKYLNIKPEFSYLLIEIIVRNDSNRQKVSPRFKLIDENKVSYEISKKYWTGVGNLRLMRSLNPNVSKEGYIVFDAPQNHHYKLRVSNPSQAGAYAFVEIKSESVRSR
jgi:hypothetical protein